MKNLITTFYIFFVTSSFAQNNVIALANLKYPMDSLSITKLNQGLESLFSELDKDSINHELLLSERQNLTESTLLEIMTNKIDDDTTNPTVINRQLINIYPISEKQFSLSISYTLKDENSESLLYILNLIVEEKDGDIAFSIPIDYLTRYWKMEQIGNTRYFFRNSIDTKRAELFDKKHKEMASKLGVIPEIFDFYMCDNYQEILKLRGLEYSKQSNGKYRTGHGVDNNIIFSVMNNEDFSHDLLHYYSGQLYNRDDRNWVTEEGLAYYWGNAYYTDPNGEMITQVRLVKELKKYLKESPDTSLWELFVKNDKIFDEIAPEISVRSTISGIILNEIEQKKGIEGIHKMITCGRVKTMISYLNAADELIGINKKNFDSFIKGLLDIR